MQTLLLAIELCVAVLLIVFVLLQKSEGGALGIGGGGGGGGGFGGLFSPRGASDSLTRGTAILGIIFFATCLALNLLVAHSHPRRSILDSPAPAAPAQTPVKKQAPAAPAQPAPAVPAVPNPH